MKGSNSYIAVGIDMFLKSINTKFRIATQSDLETNLQMFENGYVDSGLALRNLTGANKEQAKYLFNQLKQRGVTEISKYATIQGINQANTNYPENHKAPGRNS